MRSLRVLICLATLAVAVPASALSVRDVVDLAHAGVPAPVIVAMIDADGTVFTLTPAQLVALRAAHVPDEVIVKMLRTRQVERDQTQSIQNASRDYPPPSTIAAAVGDTPGLVIIGSTPSPSPPDAAAFVPTYIVPWPFWGRPAHAGAPTPFLDERVRGFGRFINDGVIVPDLPQQPR